MEYCHKNNYQSIAVPLLDAGISGLDKNKVEETIKEAADKFPNLDIKLVIKEQSKY